MNGLRITLAAGVAAALACTATSRVAHADENRGLAIGLRVGYAIPFGDAQQSVNVDGTKGSTLSMERLQRGMLPIWFDLGYRFSPHVYLGLFYQYAPTFPPSGNCAVNTIPSNGPTTCDGFDQRFGLDLHYHIRPKELIDPWIGLGLGYEMTQLNHAQGGGSDTGSFQAWGPQADLQLGLDLRFADKIPFGPFVDLSVSEFGTENNYDPNGRGTPVAFDQTLHGWVTLGVRAQFNL
jgi:hypothetical protein